MASDPLIERIRRAPSPRIRRQLAEAGIDLDAFDVSDLAKLAPLDPSALDLDRLDDPVGEIRLADAPAPVRLGICERGGATIVLTWTARDLARAATAGAELLRRAGLTAGARIANTLEGGFATPGSLLFGDAAEALGALDVPLGPVPDERSAASALDLLARVGVDALVLDAQGGGALVSALAAGAPRSLRTVLWLGVSPPVVELPVPCRRWLAVAEVAPFLAVECGHGSLHLEPGVLAELRGERLLVTRLSGDTPLLCVDSHLDALRVGTSCACGLESPYRIVAKENPRRI